MDRMIAWGVRFLVGFAAVVGVVWLLVSFPPYDEFTDHVNFFGRLFQHPILPLQIVLLALIAWGGLGAGVGVQELFWPRHRWHQFLIGMTASWLVGQVLFSGLLLGVHGTGGPADLPKKTPGIIDMTVGAKAKTDLVRDIARSDDPNATERLKARLKALQTADRPDYVGADEHTLYPSRSRAEVRAFGHWLLWFWVGGIVFVLVPRVVTPAFREDPSRHVIALLGAALPPLLVYSEVRITEEWGFNVATHDWVVANTKPMLYVVRVVFFVLGFLVSLAIFDYVRFKARTSSLKWLPEWLSKDQRDRVRELGVGLASVSLWGFLVWSLMALFDTSDMTTRITIFHAEAKVNALGVFGIVQSVLAVVWVTIFAVAVLRFGRVHPPVIMLCFLLMLLDTAYWCLWEVFLLPSHIGAMWFLVLCAGVVARAAVANSGPYKCSLPNLDEFYEAADKFHRERPPPEPDELRKSASQNDDLANVSARTMTDSEELRKSASQNDDPPNLVRIDYDFTKKQPVDHLADRLELTDQTNPLTAVQIPSEKPLRAMCERWQKAHPGQKPRIALVCSSGGGALAALWAAVVLEGLERAMPGGPGAAAFRDHIRMLTGASGGMVGAALYAAEFERRSQNPFYCDPETELGWVSGIFNNDSLSAVIQEMLWHDLPSIFLRRNAAHDRGRRLEQIWDEHYDTARKRTPSLAGPDAGFRRTFRGLYPLEEQGLCPSLVFSPMFVEDARRLLVSNLDLEQLTSAAGSRIMPNAPHPAGTLLSRSAIEFFRLFPTAREKFRVGTAARMNASFPLISPAVALPTFPPRRTIDAGFFDNFGVSLAASWVLKHEAAVREYTSGVVLVEVRAFRYGATRRYFLDPALEGDLPEGKLDPAQSKRRSSDPLGAAAAWASAPFEALLSLRQRGAFYRNDELLQMVHERFNGGHPKNDPFFTTVGFECPEDAALNWVLRPGEAKRVGQGFFQGLTSDGEQVWNPRVVSQVAQLREWFGTGGR